MIFSIILYFMQFYSSALTLQWHLWNLLTDLDDPVRNVMMMTDTEKYREAEADEVFWYHWYSVYSVDQCLPLKSVVDLSIDTDVWKPLSWKLSCQLMKAGNGSMQLAVWPSLNVKCNAMASVINESLF